MEDVPAYVCSAAMDVLAWNTLGGLVSYDFAALEPRERNLARLYFLHEEQSRSLYPEWEAGGEYMAATLRADVGRHPDDPALGALIADLLEHSAQFRRCWDQQHVRGLCYGVKHVTHPVAGELWLHYESLPLPSDPGQTLVTFTAEPGSATEKALRLLATRATPQPVPVALSGRRPILTACQMTSRTNCSVSTTCCCPSGTSTRRWASTGGPGFRWRSASTRPGSPC